jgi:probable rRNA maturation factor
VIINVINQQTVLKISVNQVQQLVQAVITQEGEICDEVNIYFVDTPTICQLHEQFFNDPSPTDCISFPIDEEQEEGHDRLLGEAFVCPATAITYASEHQGNAYLETTLYLTHSLLHLMGYDDIEEEDINLMRQAEKRHMDNLKHMNLYLRVPTEIENCYKQDS